jgi:hypothetical protein
VCQLAEHVVDPIPTLRIDADGGFVQEEDAWLVHDSAGDVQPPAHAPGELVHAVVLAIDESRPFERPFHVVRQGAAYEALQASEDLQVLARGEEWIQCDLLWNDAEFGRRAAPRDDMTEQPDLSRVESHPSRDGAYERGLPCAVRPEQCEQFSPPELEARAVKRSDCSELFSRIRNLQHVHLDPRA